ncbi:MAG: alpha-mannosidase [Prolixibacteraceae bacterium]|nr:alpha-mannosidase [Prolixibacteraceae bacterium]
MDNTNNSKKQNQISRRSFISKTATGTAFLAFAPVTSLLADNLQQATLWPANAPDFKFHMIGHAHIDPVWLWPWTEGVAIVHSTFQSALDRMNETPGFCFISSSAQFYHWVAENDPEMMKKIRKRVEEGRWNVIGGWWVEPDINIPGGEAMVRQGLYGQLTFQKLFGCKATIGFNPDSFGHTSTLPQIIKKQGMDNYIFMRPGPHEKTLPADLFWWKGKDGTEVLTYRIEQSYNDSGVVKNRLEKVLAQVQNQPMKSFMYYFGAGDHGGGATKDNIKSIEELKIEKGAPAVFYSTPERYFKEIRADKNLKLAVVDDDLQHHAVGCYTAESEIKKGNRQSETALITAEKIVAIGSWVWGANYPKKELTTAWQRVLFLQFHDSLAGSSLFDHSQAAREGYGFAMDIAHQASYMAIQKLEWQIAAEDPDSQYMVVFNPHAWEVIGNVEYDFNWNPTLHKTSRVDDEKGNPLPHQFTGGSSETGSRRKLIVHTAIPAMGYRQIRLWDGGDFNHQITASAKDNVLENDKVKVTFSYNGTLGILDKQTGKEVFAGGNTGCHAIIIDDPSDTWSHDIKTYDKEIGAFGNATLKILENGPLRSTMRVVASYGDSKLTIDWTLYAGSKNLEAKVTLDWHEHLKMLKFSFPVNVESPVATYETPYGHIVREANGNEDPGQRWIDVTGKRSGSNFGLTVMNDAKYGYNILGNDMRISVARAAVFAHHNPKVLDLKNEYMWMDQGIQTFRMLLVPHQESWQESNIIRLAEEFSAPPLSIYQGIHGGSLPKSDSLLSIDSPNVVVSAIKNAETGDDLIIRCVESAGKAASVTIDLGFSDRKWSGSFTPCEIKTLRVNKKSGVVKEVNLLEE